MPTCFGIVLAETKGEDDQHDASGKRIETDQPGRREDSGHRILQDHSNHEKPRAREGESSALRIARCRFTLLKSWPRSSPLFDPRGYQEYSFDLFSSPIR
jgi:hypothetical protein